jgi:hypothetical protein
MSRLRRELLSVLYMLRHPIHTLRGLRYWDDP